MHAARTHPVISSVLIANRGEIALRVMRTCRRLGIRTIAVNSDADRDALHVKQADEAYRVGPAPATESYLNQQAILDAARRSGAQAIHPGYGFLSENADFADAVLSAGLIWIGPPPAAMRMLGEKAPAKALAERLGVPVLPGYHGDDQDADNLQQRADDIGYPLLIKASAGGGGRGMRLVESESKFSTALESARREAQSSFANQEMLLEKYVVRPRHVEVQVFGDAHGNVIHIGERECSIQRRHQKLLEESPSPAVSSDLRRRMGAAAVSLARAAGYQGAGTVEFLLDAAGRFYFLELNARLQVEHPVTEMVTGLDLVELQLQVANGQPLSLTQDDVRITGHAIEARIIAEDPSSGFLPSTGMISTWSFPEPSESVRIDSGFEAGSEVTPYYDSLLAKLIVHAEDRAGAVGRLREALSESAIAGPRTNLDLLLAIAEHPAFERGDLHTGFLDEHAIVASLSDLPPEVLAAASALVSAVSPASTSPVDPWRVGSTWRAAGTPRRVYWQTPDGATICTILSTPGSRELSIQAAEQKIQASIQDAETVAVGGSEAKVRLAPDGRVLVGWRGRSYHVTPAGPPDVSRRGTASGASDGAIIAPMPGRVVKVTAALGDTVSERQPLLVLESMKIEHVVTASRAGEITRLDASEGSQVQAGAILAEIVEARSESL
jgi:3-methylcrotonyl-CoA carboxylase alpha subunit